MILKKNFIVVFTIDIILLISSFYIAHLIRFDFSIPDRFFLAFIRLFPIVIGVKITAFFFFDLYNGMWRYTGISDLLNVIKASTASTLIIILFILYSSLFVGFSRSVFIIDWCLMILFISAFRLCIRFYFERFSGEKFWNIVFSFFRGVFRRKKMDVTNLLIIGAGDCGEKIYREIRDNPKLKYNVVGFIDDHSTKIGKKIHSIPVVSNMKNIKASADKIGADEVLIATPSATAQQMRTIFELCKESGLKFKTVPGLGELLNGSMSVKSIRDVAYRDLLSREVIHLDEKEVGAYLKGQKVFVTGAGGSIGSELCRQICRFNPEKIILYERAESPLYNIELELKHFFKKVKIIPLLADILDIQHLEKAMEHYRPKTVFHAAAYKHVPMLELQPWKAIDNNILGTFNVVETAKKFAVERFVFVSTDKAVRPANVMGTTKRIAEMLVQSQNSCGLSKTRFMIVRFGNIVGSVGSVVPLFKKQIEKGGPVTVTHPEVTRYFMTVQEACQLILQAGAMGKGSELFLFDMGTPVKIADMARDLIRLSGYEPDKDIKIKYIGLRPGDKLFEELITEGEGILPSRHEKILILKGTKCNPGVLNGNIHKLVSMARHHDADEIKNNLQKIVPEYKPAQKFYNNN